MWLHNSGGNGQEHGGPGGVLLNPAGEREGPEDRIDPIVQQLVAQLVLAAWFVFLRPWDPPLKARSCSEEDRIYLTKQGESMFANRLANVVRRALEIME